MRNASDVPELPALMKLAIAQGIYPRYLYKYRGVNEFAHKILIDSMLWCASPRDFNDPFDCRTILSTTCTELEMTQFVKDNNPGVSQEVLQTKIQEYARQPAVFEREMRAASETIISRTGVCCFGQDPGNILMWSHYGDSHRGLCFTFDLLADPAAFSWLFRVEYCDDYPGFNYIQEPDRIPDLVRAKAGIWRYEQEWRVVKHGAVGAHPFAKNALREITFGCKATPAFVDDIKRLAHGHGFGHVTYQQALPDDAKFGLTFAPL